MSTEFTEEKREQPPLPVSPPPPRPLPPSSIYAKERKEAFQVMDRLAGAVVGEGGVAVRGSSFLMGIFHLLYTFLSPVPYSQLSISFMINRYARKLLTLSLGIMLITKSNLCKKKKGKWLWEDGPGMLGRREGGAGGSPAPAGGCPAKPGSW